MSATQTQVEKLMHEKENCEDPTRLWVIAQELNRLGAWDAAKIVMNKARQKERKYAESVNT
jgi:hypothetical protein